MKLGCVGPKERYHLFHDRRDEGREERSNVDTKFLPRIPSTSAKNSAEDIPTANIVRDTTVAQREGKGSDVIGDNTIRGVNTICILCAEFSLIWPGTSQFLDFVEYWDEDVGVVIRAFVLNDGDQSLETHTSIDMFRRKRSEGAISLAVELNEHVVPYFQNIWVVFVDEVRSITAAYPVEVNFTVFVESARKSNKVHKACLHGPHGPTAPISVGCAVKTMIFSRD